MSRDRIVQDDFFSSSSYSLMLECWEAKPSSRPSFTALAEKFGNLLEDRVRSVSMDFLSAIIFSLNFTTSYYSCLF